MTVTARTVTQIADALGEQLGAVGVRALPYLSDTFTPPVALVGIDTVAYHGAFGFSDAVHVFTVFVVLARSSDRAALIALEGYMSNTGSSSIRAALETSDTFGADYPLPTVTDAGPAASISINGAEYVSCPFKVQVHAD